MTGFPVVFSFLLINSICANTFTQLPCFTGAGELLLTVAGSVIKTSSNNLLRQGGNQVIPLSPEHAATVARDGYTKEDIKEYIYRTEDLIILVVGGMGKHSAYLPGSSGTWAVTRAID